MLKLLWLAPVAGLLCLYAQRNNTAYVWNPVRIVAGGYIPGIVAHPTEPGLIYARTDIGSVYRWNAGGNQWVPLTDFQPPSRYNLNGPESIALDPTDPDRLYIAAGMYTCTGCPFAILASTDRGATFNTYSVPFQMGANNDGRSAGERLAINPYRPNRLLMGTRNSGLWKSDDYARTWSRVAGFPLQSSTDGFGVQWVVFDPANSGTAYAGAYSTASIYRSKDDGATWEMLPGQPLAWPFAVPAATKAPVPVRAAVNPDGNLYVAYGDQSGPNSMSFGLVEKFDPANLTWTNVTPPLDRPGGESTQRGGFCGLTQDPRRPGTVAVSTIDRWYPVDTVYLTHDGGATWTDLARLTSAAGPTGLNAGNYYFAPAVFSAISPWLTFGNTAPQAPAKFGWWMSALLIDPVNPEHLMFATGATIYATDNLSAADSGQSPSWRVQALGIEETAVLALISPKEGAHLLSGVGDIGGFRHDDFKVSPAAGMYTNPVATTVGSMDWAGQSPSSIVRTQSPSGTSTKACNYGALSADGGISWTPFPACAAGANSGNGGPIAIDAAAAMLQWTPASGTTSRPQYSNDRGATWNTTAGLPGRFNAVADKVTPKLFYAFGAGVFYSTGDSGGTAFTAVNAKPLPAVSGTPVVNFARSGDIWLPLGGNGLHHSIDGGVTWIKLPNVTAANSVAVGAALTGRSPQAVFLYGTAAPAGSAAIYRSDDNGASWLRINDDEHQYGGPTLIQADTRVYGRVFLGMNGRGIVYGDLPRNVGVRR